jgi:PAS domain S-box-containing protein
MQHAINDGHLRAVLDQAPDGVLVERMDRIVYVNRAYAAMLGYPSTTALLGSTITEIAHPDDLDRLTWFGRCRREGRPAPARYSFRACDRAGAVVTFDASISQIRIDGEVLITTVVRELAPQPESGAGDMPVPGLQRLSAREREVLEHVLAGRRSKEIAAILNVSEKTICTHRSRAFRKLALRGERDLFRLAMQSSRLGNVL